VEWVGVEMGWNGDKYSYLNQETTHSLYYAVDDNHSLSRDYICVSLLLSTAFRISAVVTLILCHGCCCTPSECALQTLVSFSFNTSLV